MTTQPETIRQSDLLNQLIINRQTMEELGHVEILWMYAPSHRVLGFIGKAGFLGAKKTAFKLAQISTLGANGILTHSQPEETDAEKVRLLESVIQCEVWSESGARIGKITDYVFNLKTGEIAQYLFVSDGLGGVLGELYQLVPRQILSIGRRRVLVTDSTAKHLTLYRGGIKHTIMNAGEFLKDEHVQVTEELQTLTQQAKSATEQVKGRFLNLTGQIKERVQVFSQQAQETVQTFNEQIKEGKDTVVWQAKETGQTLVEQLKERTQTLSEQVEDGIQTLTVQAREIFEADADEAPVKASGKAVEVHPPSPSDALVEAEGAAAVPTDATESDPFDMIFAGEEVLSVTSDNTLPEPDPFDLIFGEEAIAPSTPQAPQAQALGTTATEHNPTSAETSLQAPHISPSSTPEADDEPWI